MPDAPHPRAAVPPVSGTVLVIGAGRMGTALVRALAAAGVDVQGPAGRDATAEGADIVLLAVPDAAIATASARIASGRLVGHVSGATTLEPLAPHEAFSIHPLMTVTAATVSFAGVPAALAGSTPRARSTAAALAGALGLAGFEVADADRAAYHAAASIASNFLVALEGFAEELAGTAGVEHAVLVPLVRATVDNWATAGARDALTGPIARGDHETVARQRAAVAKRLPGRLALFDALVLATRDLANGADPDAAAAAAGSEPAPRESVEHDPALTGSEPAGQDPATREPATRPAPTASAHPAPDLKHGPDLPRAGTASAHSVSDPQHGPPGPGLAGQRPASRPAPAASAHSAPDPGGRP